MLGFMLNRSAGMGGRRSVVGIGLSLRSLLYHRVQMCRVNWTIEGGVGEKISGGCNISMKLQDAGCGRILELAKRNGSGSPGTTNSIVGRGQQ